MNTRNLIFIALAVVILVVLAGGGYWLLGGGRRSDLRTLLAEARAEREATAVAATPAPTPTPDAAEMERLLGDETLALRLAAARTLADRDDIPVKKRAPLLVAALEAEVAAPSADAPRVRDTYLPAGGVLRLTLVRSLSELGKDAQGIVRASADEASGLTREHLLVALAYLGEREALPEVRVLLHQSEDPVVRMDAARALGIAKDKEAIPDLIEALKDPYLVEARDSLGEYSIYPVREQAAGALSAMGVVVTRQPGDTFVVEGR